MVIFIATCGIAVPSFVICTLLLMLFGLKLGWLPTVGLNSVLHYIMPVTALAFYPTAYIARLMRSSMLDVLGQDYMRTARAKASAVQVHLQARAAQRGPPGGHLPRPAALPTR